MNNETNINTNGRHFELQSLAAPEPGEGGSETPTLPNLPAPTRPAIASSRRRKSDEGGSPPNYQPPVAPKSDEGGSTPGAVSLTGSPTDTPTLSPSTSDDEAFHRLARLSPAEYDRVRRPEAKRLRIRTDTLDAEVSARRAELNRQAAFNSTLLTLSQPDASSTFPSPPRPGRGTEGEVSISIRLDALLTAVASRFTRYVVLPPGAANAIALWTAHAHAYAAFLHTPRLNLSSPESGCGKTTTLDLLATMTPRPLRTENLTAPVLFRLVDQHQPTLLLDEVDAYLTQAEELRGLLNAGHKRGACAYRCEGENNAVRAFKAFAPAVLAGIGELPRTLADRSVRIPLVRARPDQLAARFDGIQIEVETKLCEQLAHWARENFAALQSCNPKLPEAAFNRLADNWRPLFAIAEIAGGDWPALALEAFTLLTSPAADSPSPLRPGRGTKGEVSLRDSNGRPPSSPRPGRGTEGEVSKSFLLLSAIHQIFIQSGATKMPTRQLLAALAALPIGADAQSKIALSSIGSAKEDPQSKIANQKSKISAPRLALALRPLGIYPRDIRIGKLRAKGYYLSDFTRVLKS